MGYGSSLRIEKEFDRRAKLGSEKKEKERRRLAGKEYGYANTMAAALSDLDSISGALSISTEVNPAAFGGAAARNLTARREKLSELLRARQSDAQGRKSRPGQSQTRLQLGSI